MIRSKLDFVFPRKKMFLISGLITGLSAALAFSFPYPISDNSWLPVVLLYAAVLTADVFLWKHEKQAKALGWKAAGFLLAGLIFPLLPLTGYCFYNNPKACLFIGLVLILLDLIRSIKKES